MIILITGSSSGIGYAVSKYFLSQGFKVIGIDLLPSGIDDKNYTHYIADISDKDSLPDIRNINYIFNNAGKQNCNDIDINLKGTINVTEKYAFQRDIKAVLFNASSSAHSGFEFPEYSASKAGIIGYMKNVSWRLAKEFKALSNSISLGGVKTSLNDSVMNDEDLFNKIMEVTPLKKWMDLDEVCEWVYFLLIKNKSMSGQDVLIDNGEKDLNCTFVWPNFN